MAECQDDQEMQDPDLKLPEQFTLTSIRALRMTSRRKIAQFLNLEGSMIACETDMGYGQDQIDRVNNYNGLAELIQFDYLEIQNLTRARSPTEELLEQWTSARDGGRKATATVGNLWRFLYMMERFDVLKDCRKTICHDCRVFEDQQLLEESHRFNIEQDPTVSSNTEMLVDEVKFADTDSADKTGSKRLINQNKRNHCQTTLDNRRLYLQTTTISTAQNSACDYCKESARLIIDLSNSVKEKEKELQIKEASLLDHAANENILKAEIKQLESSSLKLEATNQTLMDEHQALQMTFAALEDNYRKVKEDNGELMTRLIVTKLKEADRVNRENETFYRHKQKQLQEGLAYTDEEIKPKQNLMPGIVPTCLSASIPNKTQAKFDAHDGEVNAVMWSPTENMFATGGSDRNIKLWEYDGVQCTCKGYLLGSNAGITSLDFDDKDGLLLGSSNDCASRIWSLEDQRLRHTLSGHSDKVLSAKFFGDSSKVASGSHDRTLKIWDLNSKACIKTIFAGSRCNDLVTLHGSNIISGHFDRKIRFWDARSENITNEITLRERVSSLALHPDKTAVLACSRDDTLNLIDLRMNQVVQSLGAENFKLAYDRARAVLSPDGCYAAAGSSDGTLFVWNVQTGKVERQLKEHSHAIIACSWHPVGSHILSCEKQKKVVLWSDM